MKKVSVKFFKDGKWAVDLVTQIKVKNGEVVNDLPIEFASKVEDSNNGEIVKPETKVVDDDKNAGPLLLSYSQLNGLDPEAVRTIGESYGVKSPKIEKLIDMILCSQSYTKDYLDDLGDQDLIVLAVAKEVDMSPLKDTVALTAELTDYLASEILGNEEAA